MKRFVCIYFLIMLPVLLFGHTLTIDDNSPSIEPFAFSASTEIDTLRILQGCTTPLEIGEYAFWNCSSLREIEIPESCHLEINEGAFRNCTMLTEVMLPEGVVLNGQYIFSGCSALTSVSLPHSLATIPPHTFSYCSSLTDITLPSGLKKLGNNCFSECSSLREITIPDSVTELESYAFSGCVSMKEARLPGNNALLGELIFSGCTNMKRLTESCVKAPPFDCNSFIFEPDDTEAYTRCLLIVPEVSVNIYRKAHGWNLFRYIKGSEDPLTNSEGSVSGE